MAVFILVYTHRHGVDVSAYDTEPLAMEHAVGIVEEYLEETPESERARIRDLITAGDKTGAIEAFCEVNHEQLDIHEADIQTAEVTTPLKPMCPKCTSTDPKDFEIKETFSAYHPVLGVNSQNQVGVENALGTSCPSEHFDDGESDYVAHCKCCQHDGTPQSFGLGDPTNWEWL
jgi:hypothetical protein